MVERICRTSFECRVNMSSFMNGKDDENESDEMTSEKCDECELVKVTDQEMVERGVGKFICSKLRYC